MQRVKRSTAVAVLPLPPAGGTPGYFAAPVPGSVAATVPGYEWHNHVQEEIMAVIEGQSMTGSDTDNTQLRQAITKMIQAGQRSVIINNATFAAAVTGSGKAVYWDSANSRFDLALADGSAKQNCVGFADVPNGNVYCYGDAVLFAGLTPGVPYYLSAATAGAITAAAPANVVFVGIAKGATELLVDIDPAAVTPTAFQQDLYTSAVAAGTADAITASFSPAITLATLATGTVTLTIWPTAANLTTAPTFTPNAGVVPAWTVVKGNNLSLTPGDIQGTGHPVTLQANYAASKWVLLNPAFGVAGHGQLLGITRLTTAGSGTFTKQAATNSILVRAVAAGGGGAGASSGSDTAGSGGYSGAYGEKLIASPAASYAYTVGAAGLGGAVGAPGSAGGATSFGVMTLNGGPGGVVGNGVSALPTGSGWDFVSASPGGLGMMDSTTNSHAAGGMGAPSPFAGGGVSAGSTSVAGSYGSGGGGGYRVSGTAYAGSNGGVGYIEILEFA